MDGHLSKLEGWKFVQKDFGQNDIYIYYRFQVSQKSHSRNIDWIAGLGVVGVRHWRGGRHLAARQPAEQPSQPAVWKSSGQQFYCARVNLAQYPILRL